MHPRSLLLSLKPKVSLDRQAYLSVNSFTKNKATEHKVPQTPSHQAGKYQGKDERPKVSPHQHHKILGHTALVQPFGCETVTPVQTGTADIRGFKSLSTYVLVEGIVCIFASQRQIHSMDIIQQLPRYISYT